MLPLYLRVLSCDTLWGHWRVESLGGGGPGDGKHLATIGGGHEVLLQLFLGLHQSLVLVPQLLQLLLESDDPLSALRESSLVLLPAPVQQRLVL